MELLLTSEDLKKIDDIIQVTPFKYAYPFFQFFTQKIQEESKKKLEAKKQVNDTVSEQSSTSSN